MSQGAGVEGSLGRRTLAAARREGAVTRGEILWLSGILAVALVLRIVGLNGPLWFDEIVTVVSHLRLSWAEMMTSYSMNHHYLFSFEAKAAMSAFGEEPWAIRLPALVFGLGSIVAAWWLARDLAGATVALVVAGLMALSFHHIWFSQNARGYTELAFWSTLGMGLFLRGVRDPRPGIWLGFALTLTLAIFTHLTGAFFFLALGLVWLPLAALRARQVPGLALWPFVGFALGLVLTLLLFSPLVPSLLDTVARVPGTTAGSAVPQYGNPLWTLTEAVRTAIGQTGPANLAVVLLTIALATLGGVSGRGQVPLFGLIVLVHIAVTMALLLAIGMRIWPRFFFLDIGFLLILITLGVRTLCGAVARALSRDGATIFAVAVAAMLLISAGLATRNYLAPKQDLAGAVAAAAALARPDERIYAVGHGGEAFESYFLTGWQRIMTPDDFAAALEQPGPLMLVVAFPSRTYSAIPAMRTAVDSGTLTVARRLPGTLGDGNVVILQR